MPQTAEVLAKDSKQKTATELQAVLVDLIDLSLQGKQAHWNVVGPLFRAIHLELDELVEDSRKWADEIAERIRALEFPADGRASVIVRQSELASLPEGVITDCNVLEGVGDQLVTVVARAQDSIDRLDGADKASEDLLIKVVQGVEKHLWMFRSQQA